MHVSRSGGGSNSGGIGCCGDGGDGGGGDVGGGSDRGRVRSSVVGLCCCTSDANIQTVGTREQDEAQIPCCYPHLPNNMCVLRGGTA